MRTTRSSQRSPWTETPLDRDPLPLNKNPLPWTETPPLGQRPLPLDRDPSPCSGGSRISPRRGRQLPRRAPTYDFDKISKNCMKLKEFGLGSASLAPPLRSATALDRDPLNRDPPCQRSPRDRDLPLNRDPPWTNTPLWTETPRQRPSCGQANTSENITFPQLRLRAVNIGIRDFPTWWGDFPETKKSSSGIWTYNPWTINTVLSLLRYSGMR